MNEALVKRFWERVIRPKDPFACWFLRRKKGSEGTRAPSSKYDFVTAGSERMLAHRLAWEIFNGPIPDGMLVRHQCDNPMCVNWRHLVIGTPQQNVGDAIERNRLNPATATAPDGYLSLAEAAAKMRVGVRRMQILCKQGRVEGALLMLGVAWIVPEHIVVSPGKRGPKLRG